MELLDQYNKKANTAILDIHKSDFNQLKDLFNKQLEDAANNMF